MDQNVIYSSEHIAITRKLDDYYLESFKNGMTIDQFNKLMGEHPEIRITSFMAVKNGLLFAPKPPTKFGEVKERITIEVSSDELRAYVTLSVSEDELEASDLKVKLIKEIIKKLNESDIIFGVKQDVLLNGLCNNKQILISEGIPPENGKDSVIRMYEIKEAKPEAKEDGNVDHYELNLINKVEVGAWMGERIDPTDGTPGKSVKGNTVAPVPGKIYPLLYDKNSIRESYENGVTILYALRTGAVFFQADKICISNHLEIPDNVDFRTGNIDFDGFLTVKGSVEDNFSVIADKDIEVLGDYGVGSIREIISRDGSVFIKGGIAGKNKAIIKSKKNIYTKFVADATIICEGSLHVGFYCLNSNIIAKELILDSPKGQIIGGNIQVDIRVISSIYGSASEKKTMISVKGFDRKAMKERLEKVMEKLEALKNELTKTKQEMSIYTNTYQLTKEQMLTYEAVKDRFFTIKNEMKILEEEKKALVSYLRTHGEGEVAILKKAYPATFLEIKKHTKEIVKPTLSTTYYVQDGEWKEVQ